MIEEHNDRYVSWIVNTEEGYNEYPNRNFEYDLKEWRLKERKKEFTEALTNLNLKNLMPRS